MARHPIYISIDVEADGPIPGPYSMLQFGAAAFDPLVLAHEAAHIPVSTFKANLDLLPGASQSPDTMAWWAKQGDAYANTRVNLQEPSLAVNAFMEWCQSFNRKPIIVGYPVTYDFMWVYWYCVRFGGLPDGVRPPFSFSGMDIKTVAAVKLNCDYPQATKRGMPKAWFKGAPKHTHDALDDAIGQGVLFVNMMRDLRQ